jgi:hypothetical protein
MKRDQVDAVPHLRDTVMDGIDQGIGRIITHSVECLDDLLYNIMATVI